MKAFISPLEPVATGFRICEVQEAEFPIAEPYFWLDVPAGVAAGSHFYNPITASAEPIPAPVFLPQVAAANQPAATGVQTL